MRIRTVREGVGECVCGHWQEEHGEVGIGGCEVDHCRCAWYEGRLERDRETAREGGVVEGDLGD